MRFNTTISWLCAIVTQSITINANGVVVSFTSASSWQKAVNFLHETIDFLGLPHDTFITTQYASNGITFSGENLITGPTPAFPNDQWGLFAPNNMRFTFDAPQHWIAVDFPGSIKFQLFSQGELIYTSPSFIPGGLGNFVGLVSDIHYDEVLLYKHPGLGTSIFIDDLHWGSAVPAPGGMLLLLMATSAGRRRRR